MLGHLTFFLPFQCWCKRFSELSVTNNIGRTRRQARSKKKKHCSVEVSQLFLSETILKVCSTYWMVYMCTLGLWSEEHYCHERQYLREYSFTYQSINRSATDTWKGNISLCPDTNSFYLNNGLLSCRIKIMLCPLGLFINSSFHLMDSYWKLKHNTWFSQDITKIKTKELHVSIILSFYFHEVLQQLNTLIYTNLQFEGVLCFAIEDAWTSRVLRDTAFS